MPEHGSFRRVALLLSTVLILAATAMAGDSVVPVQQGMHLLFVHLKINGKDAGTFLVDTGGQMTYLDIKFARTLNLPPAGQATVSGPAGNQPASLYDVDSITVGDRSTGRMRIVAGDLSFLIAQFGVEVNGILAADFWKQYPFTIDYQASTITLHDRASFKPPAGAVEGKLTLIGTAPYVEATVDSKYSGLFHLDTGATMPLNLNNAFVAKFPESVKSGKAVGGSVFGMGGIVATSRVAVPSFTLLGQTMKGVFVQYVVGGKTAPGEQPGGTVGASMLQNYRITYDYANSVIYAVATPVAPLKAPLAKTFKVDEQDVAGVTPLMMAANDVRVADAKVLLAAGADVNLCDNLGRSPLYMAASRGSGELVTLFLSKKATVEALTRKHQNPLGASVDAGDPEVCKMLLDAKADPNSVTTDELTPLVEACVKGNLAVATLLIERGAKVTYANSRGGTPIAGAAISGNAKLAQLLISKGADVNSKDSRGITPLMIAAVGGFKDLVQTLIDNKADVNMKGARGETALALAKATRHQKVADILTKAGAQ